MKFYLDSANLDEIREGLTLGIEGVTTNPTSAAKAGVPYADLIWKIVDLGVPEVSAQVLGSEFHPMYIEAHQFAEISKKVVVKVPSTADGIAVVRAIFSRGLRFNVTLIFDPIQAILAANAGAYIVSPFLARTNDAAGCEEAGPMLIETIKESFVRHGLKTKVLAASIRNAGHVAQALEAGADICTMSLPILRSLYQNEQTAAGLAKMMADWNAAQQKTSIQAEPGIDWTAQTR